jgi:hypothetical protein
MSDEMVKSRRALAVENNNKGKRNDNYNDEGESDSDGDDDEFTKSIFTLARVD